MHDQLVTTPFGADSTAADVIAGVDLSGQRAIVTGGSSGIGAETARALADQASVRAFADQWHGPLHILVNNAGIMALPELRRSPEGWELQFATNHMGHFALTLALHGALAQAGAARVVAVSSVGHINGSVDFDDVQFERRPYDQWVAYGQSKTANILFAVQAARNWAADGITANSLNPGRIPGTGLMRHLTAAPASAAPAPPAAPASRSRTPSRARPPRSCWPPPRCWRGSAAATSRTAPRPDRSSPASAAASPATPLTQATPPGCGSSPSTCWPPPDRLLTAPPRRLFPWRYRLARGPNEARAVLTLVRQESDDIEAEIREVQEVSRWCARRTWRTTPL